MLLLTLVTFSFWSWLFIWGYVGVFDHTALEKYCLYNEFLLIGIVFGLGGKRLSQGPHHEFVDATRRSLRQAALGLFAVLALVFALHDNFVSRSFLISYIPWLCLTLLFANYLGPKWLSRWAFSRNREERVAGWNPGTSLQNRTLAGTQTTGWFPLDWTGLSATDHGAENQRDQRERRALPRARQLR